MRVPWSLLGLDEGFSCEAIELQLGGEGHLDHLEHGVVTVPETINARTFKGERGGLFDHAIFGALADGFDGAADFRARVEAELAAQPADDEPTPPHPRRDRFGRIDLCEPFVHPLLLLRGAGWLERVTGLQRGVLRELALQQRHLDADSGETISAAELDGYDEHVLAQFSTGATAIRSLLRRRGHDLDPLIGRIYVIPAQLRPILPLQKRKQFDSHDLNDLYRRVINRNNRLRRLVELDAPQIIMRNERAELQRALEQLFDNGASEKPVTAPKQRPLESLWDFAGGPALAERLRGLDEWVAERGYAALERGLPWKLFRTWRAIQAMGLDLGEP